MNIGQVLPGRIFKNDSNSKSSHREKDISKLANRPSNDTFEEPNLAIHSHREDDTHRQASQVKQHYNTSQVEQPIADPANAPIDTLPSQSPILLSGIPNIAVQTGLLSNRPHIAIYIPLPSVDADELYKQRDIFKNEWPLPSPTAWKEDPQFCELYQDVKSFNLPNFLGARRTLLSGLNLERWEARLYKYHDREISFFLHYGWPLGYHKSKPPESVPVTYQQISTWDTSKLLSKKS